MTDSQSIKTGTIVVVDGHTMTVIDIGTSETVDGRSVIIRAMDDESARKMQLRQMQQEHMSDDAMEAVKKLMNLFSGGKFPGLPDFPEGEEK